MDPIHHGINERFLLKLDRLINKTDKETEVLLNKIKILINQHLISYPEDRKWIKGKLTSLKIQITQSRNNPRDRLLAYKILSMVKGQSTQSDESCHWKDLAESRWEIRQFRKALLADPEFNTNYEFVEVKGNPNNYLGRGREGIVYLAKEKDSGKLIAIKIKCERQPEIHPYNGEEEVKAVGLFNNATGYDFEAKNYTNFNAKTYIAGRNLEDLLKSNDLFKNSHESQEISKKLKELLIKLIHNQLFFADLAPENFIYDGNHFYIIDLRPFRVCDDVEETRKAYKNEMLDKIDDGIAWTQTRWYQPDCKNDDKAQFIKFITDILIPSN